MAANIWMYVFLAYLSHWTILCQGNNETTARVAVQKPRPTEPLTTTTDSGVVIGTPKKPTTTPPPVILTRASCEAFTIQCPNFETVHITNIFRSRKINGSCSRDRAECCSLGDPQEECRVRNFEVLPILRDNCLRDPGEPCSIFPHSSLPIFCDSRTYLSHFTIVEFYCKYIPIPTKNYTTPPTTEATTTPEPTTIPTTPSTSTTPVTTDPPVTEKPLPIAIIAGASGGGAALILLIILIVCCCRRRQQRIMKQDMTKAAPGIAPVSDVGVKKYADEEKGMTETSPDIIKTTSVSPNGNIYNQFPLKGTGNMPLY